MKRIAIADIHLTSFKNDVILDDGLPARLSYTLESCKYVFDWALDNSIEHIDILGDIFNDKSYVYTDCMNMFSELILSYSKLNFIILAGNHDLASKGDNYTTCIDFLENLSNVICVTDNVYSENNRIYVPYSKSKMSVDILTSNDCTILLSHFGLSEARVQSGISIRTNMKMSDLKQYELVLLGHYHTPQEIVEENTKLLYVGSMIHKNWNDKNECKRFIIYDDETFEIESIPLEIGKQFKEVVVDSEDVSIVMEDINEFKKIGHHVRIRNKCKEVNNLNITGVPIIEDFEDDSNPYESRNIDNSMTEEDVFNRYLAVKNIKDKKLYMSVLMECIG